MSTRRWYLQRGAKSLAVVLGVSAGVVGIALVTGNPKLDVSARPGTTWLSGEREGRVVLAAPFSDQASVAVELADGASEFSVADTGTTTFVHDRAGSRIVALDALDGSLEDSVEDDAFESADIRIVAAGEIAYAIDPANTQIRVLEGDDVGEPVDVPGFTDWVGTKDGRLWLYNARDGSYGRFEPEGTNWNRLARANSDAQLSAVGIDPVLLDRTGERLRWLRQGESVVVQGIDVRSATLQVSSVDGTCVNVVSDAEVRCYAPSGTYREMTLAAPMTPESELFANDQTLAVVAPGSNEVVLASWETETSVVENRPQPSERQGSSWSGGGPLLVDDPGSQYAFTAFGTQLVVLDKFSPRAIVVDEQGNPIDTGDAELADIPTEGVLTGINPPEEIEDTNGRNDRPLPSPDSVRTRSGRTILIDALANDRDPDGDVLAIMDAGPASAGEAVDVDAQRIAYTAPADFTGTVEFPYEVTDPGNLRATSKVTVEVVPAFGVNNPPEPQDDEQNARPGVPVDIPVLANDRDPEGDALAVVSVTEPTIQGSSAVALEDGRIRYESPGTATGTDTFRYTVTDEFGASAEATVTVRLRDASAVNSPPEAFPDRGRVVAGRRIRLEVLSNDTDPDGDAIRVVDVSQAPGASAVVVGGAAIDIAPAPSSPFGPMRFVYTVEDSRGARSTAEILVIVDSASQNAAPRAVNDRFAISTEAQELQILRNDADPDGDPLTITGVTQPMTGAVVTIASPTTVHIAPVAGFEGDLSFRYTVTDPEGLSSSASVVVEITDQRGASPVARNDQATIFPGETARIDVLANDSHPDGLPITLAGPPTVRQGRATVQPDGSILFTPPNRDIATYVLDYTIRDSAGNTASAEVFVAVVARPQQQRPPTPEDDRAATSFQTPVLIDVLANDSDPDGDALSLVAVGTPSGGTASVVGQRVRFAPAPGQTGLASFTYTVADSRGARATADVVVAIDDRPSVPPTAVNDLVTMVVGTSRTVDPRVNDRDPDGDPARLAITSVRAERGAATVVGGGVRITAPAAPAVYSITYTVADADGGTSSATIAVTATPPPNSPPTAADDAAVTPFRTAVTINVLANDRDADGGRLRVTGVTAPTPAGSGTVAVGPDGADVRFTPKGDYDGAVSFRYTVADEQGATATAAVRLTVNKCAVPTPGISGDTYTIQLPSDPVVLNLYLNDASPAGTFAVGQPAAGTGSVAVVEAGRVRFTPGAGFVGEAAFSYSVTPSCGAPATAVVRVTMLPVPTTTTTTTLPPTTTTTQPPPPPTTTTTQPPPPPTTTTTQPPPPTTLAPPGLDDLLDDLLGGLGGG